MHVIVVDPELAKYVSPAEMQDWRARLQAAAPHATFEYLAEEALAQRIHAADVIGGFVSPNALESAGDRLRWVHSWAAGPNKQLFPAFRENDVLLTCCKGNGAIPLAEHAIMLMLMLQRGAAAWLDGQRAREWRKRPHDELAGKVCAIIGTGHAGQDLALKAKAFHMRVTGIRRASAPAPGFDRIYPREDLHAFLAEADFVVMTAPLTPETKDMLGTAEFAAMKPTAYYVCISRGGIANDAALETALREQRIAGAGLDAHSLEPLPRESAFWTLPNTLVTPHNAATTRQIHERGFTMFIGNLRRYVAREPLHQLVDKKAGY